MGKERKRLSTFRYLKALAVRLRSCPPSMQRGPLSGVALLLCLPLAAQPTGQGTLIPFQILCGSATDKYFQGSTFVWPSGAPDTALPSSYLTLRFTAPATAVTLPPPLHYRITQLSLATYIGALVFVEPNKTAAGQRIVTVTVQGQVSEPIDIFALVGRDVAYVFPFVATVNVGVLDITITGLTGNPILSAIQINAALDSTPAASPSAAP